MFEAQGHTQFFTSIHLSLEEVFAVYPAVHFDGTHDSLKAWEERDAEMLCKELQFGNKATNLVGNKVYNHKKTTTNKCWSSDTLLSRILFCSPQLWLSATAIRNPR